jgi:hypothetical protein
VLGFFGFLCAPATAGDKRIAGLGFRQEDLSLALLADPDLVTKYLYFMKNRSVSNSFNTGTLAFLHLSTMLTRDKTGYLRQRPEFGAKLPRPVAKGRWAGFCKMSRLRLQEFRRSITTGKRDRVQVTRDPFEPVIDIIRERQHPITALFDLSERVESLTPLMEKGSQADLAVHCRGVFLLRLITSNPLRCENLSMMTYVPKDFSSFQRACKLYSEYKSKGRALNFAEIYVETTATSNLYQRRDGSWRLRFNECDFKNEKGAYIERGVRRAPYLFSKRIVLNETLKGALRRVLAARGLPTLTAAWETAIDQCPYVFRPGPDTVLHNRIKHIVVGYGTGQVLNRLLSHHIYSMTSRYLPESKGFHAHACQHLVATEYIKNHPNGYEEAAVALHNTAAMIRKHYSWVEVGDLIKPWNSYHEDIKAKYDKGEL